MSVIDFGDDVEAHHKKASIKAIHNTSKMTKLSSVTDSWKYCNNLAPILKGRTARVEDSTMHITVQIEM
jgi:hypothetical protein